MTKEKVVPHNSVTSCNHPCNSDGCLIDFTIQSAGIKEQHAAALARELKDLEEEIPTYEGSGHRVHYFPQFLANG